MVGEGGLEGALLLAELAQAVVFGEVQAVQPRVDWLLFAGGVLGLEPLASRVDSGLVLELTLLHYF